MSREALVLLVCCCDFRDGAERLISSKSLRNAVIRAFPGLFRILRMCAPRRAAAVVRPRERKKSADRRRRILISRLLIIRASVPRRKSPFPAYFKGFPAVSPLIPPYPAFLKYPVSPQSSRNVAQEKDKIKTLIADISHQTKTPIANLLLYSELLMEETLPASAKANVEALYKQSEKLRFLIDSLVKLSRLENGIISLSPQPTALQPLLESVVEQYTAKASEKGLSLQMQDTDAFAVFDFKWTAEALANIVDNAIKYTEHGTIRISAVSYEMFARIDISDTGSGIPETEQAKIFARFYRSKAVQEQEGVGIGLYLARQIISGEGGYIKIASVPGKGSTFSIFLPK